MHGGPGPAPPAIGADRGVRATAGSFGRSLRVYSSPPGEPRFRRATDVLLLVPALVGLGVLVIAYPPSLLERTLQAFLAAFPGRLEPLWAISYDLLGLWALALLAVAAVSRRGQLLTAALGSVLLAASLAIVSTRVAVGDWPTLAAVVPGNAHTPVFPSLPVAEAVAVILTVAPHLVRPLQTVGRCIVAAGVVGALFAGPATPGGTAAGLLVAVVAAAGVRLALGTSTGRPGLEAVARALRELGVEAGDLAVSERQRAGVFSVETRDPAGRLLRIKVYGRDAYDSQLVAKLWRLLWYEDDGPPLRLSRRQAAEHEAFVTLLARNGGVPTREVVTAGQTSTGDALLVLRGAAQPLDSAAPGDGHLRAAWRALELLAGANIAHLQLDPATVALAGDGVVLLDFAGATVAPSRDQLQTDRVQLLVTTAAAAGTDRAVAAAVDSLGTEGVAGLLPYLQAPALRAPLREATKAAGIAMDDLRTEVARAVDADVPKLVKLRRLSWWTAIQVVLLVLAAAAVLSAASNVDWPAVRGDLAAATWTWIAAGFVVAQLPRLTQACSTLGSIAARLPFGPVYMKELTTTYLNLAMPSSLGRMAVSIRFFQCQGLTGAAAVTAGAIDSLAGTAVQLVLLVLLLLFSEASLNLQLDVPPAETLHLLWILVGLLVATVLVAVLVGRIRRAIADRVRTWWPQVRDSVVALRASHKLALLLGGSLATELLFATALGLFAYALGYQIPLVDLLVINMSISLLASFIPVPGGVGVVEYGLTLGLVAAGMPQEAALAAVLLYRISTFYLPPVWGFFAMRWLQRNRYL